MASQKLGELIDALGVKLDLDDGDLVASALVITKVIQADGKPTIGLAIDEAQTWFDQLTLIEAARAIVHQAAFRQQDDE